MDCEDSPREMCRICLKNSSNVIDIYRSKINSIVIAKIISDCSSSYVGESDGMPKTVCMICYDHLKIFCELRERIKTSELIWTRGLHALENNSNLPKQIDLPVHTIKIEDDTENTSEIITDQQSDSNLNNSIENITIKVEPAYFNLAEDHLLNESEEKVVRSTESESEITDFVLFENDFDLKQEPVILDAVTIEDLIEEENAEKNDNSVDEKNERTPVKKKQTKIHSGETSKKKMKINDVDISCLVSCTDCNSQFTNEAALIDHKTKCYVKVKCKSCKKLFTQDKLKRHMELAHPHSKMFKCKICNAYISVKYYEMHMAVHKD